MECHRCLETKYRHDWTPAQWRTDSSTMYPYLGCKQCHAREPPPELVEAVRDSLRLRCWDLADFGMGQAAFLSEFREKHIGGDIKRLSHNGAVPAVYDFHPKHWHDARTGTWYFDPSNYVYKAAVQFACPEFIVQSGVSSDERLGDTIEAILGLDFELAAGGPQNRREHEAPYPQSGVSVHRAARFWRIMVYHEFVISWLLGQWPNWVADEPDTPTSPTAGTGTAATTARNTRVTTQRRRWGQPTATSSSGSTASPRASSSGRDGNGEPTATRPRRRRWAIPIGHANGGTASTGVDTSGDYGTAATAALMTLD